MTAETCEKCGAVMVIGDFPFCPHGRSTMKVIGDDIPGGLVLHNLGPEPVKVYSHSERKRIAEARGRVNTVYHVEGDKHLSRWT